MVWLVVAVLVSPMCINGGVGFWEMRHEVDHVDLSRISKARTAPPPMVKGRVRERGHPLTAMNAASSASRFELDMVKGQRVHKVCNVPGKFP